jgi:hypothetical protein
MKTIFRISLCFCVFFTSQLANAQLLKRIQEKVENKAEQKAMEKAEKAADKMLDKVLGNNKKTANTTENNKSTYTFNQSITIEVEADGNEKAQLDFLFDSTNPNVVCMKLNAGEDAAGGEVYAVITPTASTMFMNMPGMKIKKEVSKEEMGSLDYTDKVPKKSDLVKTGKTKKILGYTCYEYVYENDGGKVHAWVTNNFPIQGKFIPILGMQENGAFDGFVLELLFEGNNEKSAIKVIKIDTSTKIKIDPNSYTSM